MWFFCIGCSTNFLYWSKTCLFSLPLSLLLLRSSSSSMHVLRCPEKFSLIALSSILSLSIPSVLQFITDFFSTSLAQLRGKTANDLENIFFRFSGYWDCYPMKKVFPVLVNSWNAPSSSTCSTIRISLHCTTWPTISSSVSIFTFIPSNRTKASSLLRPLPAPAPNRGLLGGLAGLLLCLLCLATLGLLGLFATFIAVTAYLGKTVFTLPFVRLMPLPFTIFQETFIVHWEMLVAMHQAFTWTWPFYWLLYALPVFINCNDLYKPTISSISRCCYLSL